MPYYKDQTNSLCFLDEGVETPDGYIAVTNDEAAAWIAAYNEAMAAGVPQRITNYQGKVALDFFRLYEDVETYMSLPDTPRAAKLAWATGAFERQGSMILWMAMILGLTEEQVDEMFIYGDKVQ